MNEHKDYYKILGVNKRLLHMMKLKRLLERLIVETHPDKNNNDQMALINLKKLAEAWQVLQDENKTEGNMIWVEYLV